MSLQQLPGAMKGFVNGKYYCPFGNEESQVCSASLSSLVIGKSRRQAYCGGDDYDNCPIFLARMLRKKD